LLVTKAALNDFDGRWKVEGEWRGLALTESWLFAGAYLKILEAREMLSAG
jgi:hypothetical protein